MNRHPHHYFSDIQGCDSQHPNGTGELTTVFEGDETSSISGPPLDTEEDCLLSYFLSDQGDFGNEKSPEQPLFSTSFEPIPRPKHHSSVNPPSTPAIQFYGNHSLATSVSSNLESNLASNHTDPTISSSSFVNSHPDHLIQQQQQVQALGSYHNTLEYHTNGNDKSTKKGSSPPIATIAAALVHGTIPAHLTQHNNHFMPFNNIHKNQQYPSNTNSSPNHSNISPISPAALIGHGGEPLALPPPLPTNSSTIPNHGVSNGNIVSMSQPTTASQSNYQQNISPTHLQWLQHMNMIASMTQQSMAKNESEFIAPHSNPQQYTMNNIQRPKMQPSQPIVFPNQISQHIPILPSTERTTTIATPNEILSNQLTIGLVHTNYDNSLKTFTTISNNKTNPIALTDIESASNSNNNNNNESIEKRQRRLARNRESARQSRRRKKELLLTKSAQVDKLHSTIEKERSSRILKMERELMDSKQALIHQLALELENCSKDSSSIDGIDKMLMEKVVFLVQNGGPNSCFRRAVAGFQYDTLKLLISSQYQRFFLWSSLKDTSFFNQAKDERSKLNLKSTCRMSSKQLGEEIILAHRNMRKPISPKANHISGNLSIDTSLDSSNISCDANDAAKVWPLFCHELSISADQEDKLLQSYKKGGDVYPNRSHRQQINVATTMASHLKDGVLLQCHTAGHRYETSLLSVLTPSQTIKYLKWFDTNRERCRKLFGITMSHDNMNTTNQKKVVKENGQVKGETIDEQAQGDQVGTKQLLDSLHHDNSLSDICQRLTEVLRIQKKQ